MDGSMIPIVAIISGCCFLAVVTIADSARKRAKHRETEESRREIAAYVAEGSISPEDAERLLSARPKASPKHDRFG
ncbi:MAG: hypothetical protein AAGG07_10500 [Planctomycetota bacterium]